MKWFDLIIRLGIFHELIKADWYGAKITCVIKKHIFSVQYAMYIYVFPSMKIVTVLRTSIPKKSDFCYSSLLHHLFLCFGFLACRFIKSESIYDRSIYTYMYIVSFGLNMFFVIWVLNKSLLSITDIPINCCCFLNRVNIFCEE